MLFCCQRYCLLVTLFTTHTKHLTKLNNMIETLRIARAPHTASKHNFEFAVDLFFIQRAHAHEESFHFPNTSRKVTLVQFLFYLPAYCVCVLYKCFWRLIQIRLVRLIKIRFVVSETIFFIPFFLLYIFVIQDK